MGDDLEFVGIGEAARLLGISLSTAWRRVRSGELASIRRGGGRLVRVHGNAGAHDRDVPPLQPDSPIFRLVGAGRGSGTLPGAREKHAILAAAEA